ncbi:hypothetical protein ACFQ6U_33220 [Streptomyces sp. NPDC056465]
MTTWTSCTLAVNPVARVSVNWPPSLRAGAVQVTVQAAVAVPWYRPSGCS